MNISSLFCALYTEGTLYATGIMHILHGVTNSWQDSREFRDKDKGHVIGGTVNLFVLLHPTVKTTSKKNLVL